MNVRILRASLTSFPRTMSATIRAFCEPSLRFLSFALTSISITSSFRRSRFSGFFLGVTMERAGRSEFAVFVTDHLISDVDGNELLAVVNREREAYRFREDH